MLTYTKEQTNVITELANSGVELKIVKDEVSDNLLVDLNTRAKSGIKVLFNEDGSATLFKRYDEVVSIDANSMNIESFAYEVKYCMNQDAYVNPAWLVIMEKFGVIQVKREVVQKIIF